MLIIYLILSVLSYLFFKFALNKYKNGFETLHENKILTQDAKTGLPIYLEQQTQTLFVKKNFSKIFLLSTSIASLLSFTLLIRVSPIMWLAYGFQIFGKFYLIGLIISTVIFEGYPGYILAKVVKKEDAITGLIALLLIITAFYLFIPSISYFILLLQRWIVYYFGLNLYFWLTDLESFFSLSLISYVLVANIITFSIGYYKKNFHLK